MSKDDEVVRSDTPIGDQLKLDLSKVDDADITHFEEDDDPQSLAGDFVDEEDKPNG